ncbi:2-hydroxy-3-oxopropionate reductase [Streptomyces radicis]|uniref:2-hydroxy-3-oxopropionate reductase n=1 Tax=Streptomyces radicis TaxID=1750517 RepID=A0A3A9W6P4_9ACTN|nr:2-hydroxy-3-oxopropionate reductase [Streptomyces radicis]RKN04954.1 2-hydroxy-3-oxopropionate reductase [Streptomyces radicis]RKN16343.1 2-hydroxy-3-oxopropionate reductase [Streptomyces radicis]
MSVTPARTRRIAFIGLGIMGGPMAGHLVKAGHQVTGFDLFPEPVERLAAQGGRAAASVAEAVADAEVVITMVPADPHVRAVVLGDDGVLAHAAPGTLLIDMSSITPGTSLDVAAAAARVGVRTLDAPVSGGEAGAVEAVLSIMVGGAAADFVEARPLLTALGTTVVHVGPTGAGQTVKAANQLVVAGHLQILAEALVFLRKAGVDLGSALDVLGGGLAGSTVLTRKRAAMVAHDFTPGFRIDLHHKDMGIVTETARALGAPLPVGSLVAQLVQAARANGDGGLDHAALLRGVERLAGQ